MATPRGRRRLSTRDRIVEAAIALVARGGFEGLSMARLGDAVALTPGALYRYFRSKDAVIAAVTAEVVSRQVAAVEADVASTGVDGLARARGLLRAWGARALADVEGYGLLSMLLADPRTLVPDDADAAAPLAAMLQGFAPLVEALQRAADEGELAPGSALDRAVMLFSAVHGVVQLRKQAARVPGGLDLARLADEAVEAMLRGWGAREVPWG